MRFLVDGLIALLFWSFTFYSSYEVFEFFKKGAIQNIERGLSSTEKFSEALLRE